MVRIAAVVLTGFALALAVAVAQPQHAAGASPATILISRQLAEASRLTTGSVVRLAPARSGDGAREFRVTGIYEPAPDPMELNASKFEARLHLPDLLALTADPADPLSRETVSAVNVSLANRADAAAFGADLVSRFPGIMVEPATGGAGVGTFLVLQRFHLAIAIVTILASTVFLLALTVMLVDERRETVGILRLIGLTSRRVLFQVFVEGLVIAAAGALFGLALALASENLINRYFQWHYDTALVFVRITPRIWLQCLTIAIPLGAGASVAASWTLLRRHVLSLARR